MSKSFISGLSQVSVNARTSKSENSASKISNLLLILWILRLTIDKADEFVGSGFEPI